MNGIDTGSRPLIARVMTRTAFSLSALLLVAQTAEAQTRRQPNTETLTCAQTQDLVNRFGAINLKSGPHKFDRYVVSRNYCISPGQAVRTTYVPTKDAQRCPVQICVEQGRDNDR